MWINQSFLKFIPAGSILVDVALHAELFLSVLVGEDIYYFVTGRGDYTADSSGLTIALLSTKLGNSLRAIM